MVVQYAQKSVHLLFRSVHTPARSPAEARDML